ncbi:hypothetical protein [Aureibacter tunicatorum]|uniref:Lipocalin-like domain-containing protein n=1 Tax=Aureibacter tunicatorum TaxID=866807 RepID=A0AAE4BVV1_9BACT|nr:hypothetical protein [Aureibacter tunicatorum]MDR6242068.1 hypothetical protein [Aureibacter tunicatorum]BDD03643.1 hypothetical protein AUTU_11260 [Aureibacter tunicatorum]
MRKFNYLFTLLLGITVIFSACKSDDDGGSTPGISTEEAKFLGDGGIPAAWVFESGTVGSDNLVDDHDYNQTHIITFSPTVNGTGIFMSSGDQDKLDLYNSVVSWKLDGENKKVTFVDAAHIQNAGEASYEFQENNTKLVLDYNFDNESASARTRGLTGAVTITYTKQSVATN